MTGGGLLVVGEVVTDVVARHRGPLAPGTDTAATTRLFPGGSGANVACAAARSGAPSTLLASAGADFAAWHRAALREAGVRAVLRVDAALPTAVVVALVDETAERTMVTDGGAALRLAPGDWAEELLDGTGHLHVSGYLLFAEPARSLARFALERARARGLGVSVDPASAGFLTGTGAGRFLDDCGEVDVLLPNLDEARLLTGERDPRRAARWLTERHSRTTVVTLGPAGAVVCERGARGEEFTSFTVPATAARAVDSTGAGDAFTGAFLAARLAGADARTAATAGCRAGAHAVATTGARPSPSLRPGTAGPGDGSPLPRPR
ncbi:sugar kinase [Streptomyces sp. AJS327]|uniref:carbohydrate kinase family protein n=1 Tax=Streptomyces sp. AJS327 TaxID=2545265 RepID=UPI0015DDB47D|nr:sugar kinase [Streptomyces sp. AJS327]MBA0052320.1 sugar kinase [Streptomyces sp. AJS327]